MVEGELESLASILTEQEYEQAEVESTLAESASTELKDVLHAMNLSIVPNFEGKIHAKDKVRGEQLEFRSFPTVELSIVLTKAYPSHRAPLMALRG